MSKLIIIRGNSGSGKSTVAKELQYRLGDNVMIISQDVVRRDMLNARDGVNTKALPLLKDLILYGKDNCHIVILEGILNSRWYEELFELVKIEFKDQIFAYYYDIPFEETVVRHKTRTKCNDFGEREMRQWWKEKDFIKSIKETVLTKDFTVEEVIDLIMKDIKIRAH